MYKESKQSFLSLRYLSVLAAYLLVTLVISAQTGISVTGKVIDQTGEPLPGVNVLVKGTSTGVISDIDGNYSIVVPNNRATLEFSYIGFATQNITVGTRRNIPVTLVEDATALSEVVVVGYGTQAKATLTGAVSAIRGEEMLSTKNENAQNMLTGKVAGVRITQKSAEPGAFNNLFDVRGMGTPLVIIDGIPRTMDDLQRLDPNDIDNMSVLKDASAAIYGIRAANGVVLITTKQGNENSANQLSYSGSFTMQVPSGLPATVDVIDYMTLRNERNMHNVNGGSMIYQDADFEAYRTGAKTGTDWYPLVFRSWAPQTQHNLSATGGNDKVTYYVGIGYLYQDGFFQSNDLSYDKYNIRSNITAKLAHGLKLDLNLSGVMDQQNRPYKNSDQIIRAFWRQGAMIPAYADPEHTMLYHGLIEGENPLSYINADLTGYQKFNKKWFASSGTLTYDVPYVKGLKVKGLMSFDYFVSSTNIFQKEYNQYRYDEASKTYQTYTRQSPNQIKRETYMKNQILLQAQLDYQRTFGLHKVAGTLVWETQKRDGDNFSAQRNLIMPLEYLFAGVSDGQVATMDTGSGSLYINANSALAGRFNYTFAERYLLEFQFRYDGSSKFAPGYQWGFFPSGSIGWRVSEEPFFKSIDALSFINQLKLRASYGVLGDDGASSYQFISGYSYPSSTDRRNFTGGYVFDGSFVASANNKGIPNPYITWYTSKTLDIGVDFEAWNGLLGFSLDYFDRRRDGLLATRNGGIPTVVGASLPQENINSDRTFGLELEVNHRNRIGRDLNYHAKGIASITRVKRLYVESSTRGSSWDYWKNDQNNRLQGIHWGYQGIGRYDSWEEIWSSPVYIGRGTLIGDYIYEDWNGDGEINGNDSHPIRFNQQPWLNFSLNLGADWKGFDVDMLWQGSALGSLIYGEQLREPLWGNSNSSAMQQFMDRYHPVDPKADPYDPATVWVPGYFANTGTLPDTNSSFNAEDGSYLRLKSIELGYTLPKWHKDVRLRVYVNAYNVLTFTKVRYVDPEHPNDTWGYLYPLNKTYSFGVNLTF